MSYKVYASLSFLAPLIRRGILDLTMREGGGGKGTWRCA